MRTPNQNETPGAAADKIAHTPLIASVKVDKWLNELRQILVDRSEFKLADHVVSARVVILMLESNRAELLEACEAAEALLEGLCDGAPDASPLSKQANHVTRLLQAAISKSEGK